ncbi:MAG TPA: hypothetical protein VGN86_01830 [Pyrinomonadaceae bacterium]|nr:hypothetical protein [Pyrinomonadaceae bacterium]
MTKEEAVRYKEQWDLVNQARIQEVQGMTSEKKLRDLEMLFEFVEKLGRPARTSAEGWEYWRRLKEVSDV